MNEEIENYVKELLASKLEKSEEKEVKFSETLSKGFTLGSTLEAKDGRVVISNVRQHDAERDLAKAYAYKKK